MDVIFHVLVDTSLLQDDNKFQGLVLKLKSNSEEEKHELRAEHSYNDENFTELTTRASLNIEKYEYKYIFSLSDVSADEIQEYRNAGVRFFNVSTKKPRDGIYHQYDGVIRLESNRRFYQLPLTPIKSDAKISAQLFVKKIKISSSRNNFNGLMGEDLISELNFIFSSMTESYCMIYETDRMHMLRKAVITVFQQTVDDITVGYTNTEHTQNIFINAMTIAYCLADGLIELTDVEKGYLCMRLLPRIDRQFDGCADITALKCAFKKTPTEKLVLVLHNILKAVTMKPGNPSWIYCMPLLHFLDGKCKIWETAPDDVSHKQSVPLWWGTVLGRNISLDLTALKSSLYDSQMLTDIEEMLFQYSKADYLLPRAFMASVCFDQLSTVVKFRSIQPDVILAALCSFITTEAQDNYSNNVEKAFGKCKEVTDVSMHLIMQASFKFMHLLDLENVRAEKDLLKYRAHIRDLVLCVSNSAKQRLHLKFMLGKSHRYTELFRTFNLMLSSANNDGYVRECFISNLKDSIFEMLKTDEQKDMNLVMAFCDRKENYCNILTDILNDMIVEAAEKNIDQLKSQELSESRIIRLGHIFSQLFKQRIERNHAQTEAEILQLMVTWKHMPVCMKLLEKNKENDQDCKDQLHKIQPVLDKTLQELFSGQIVISNLHLIINHIDIVLEILKEMSAEVDEHNVTRSIEKNLDALESFNRTKKLLKKFVELCQLFEVNTKDIDDNIDKFKDLNSFQLSELCKIKTARGVEPVFTVVAFMFKEADMKR
ncbi:Hypothetical predicted protein [Mytilus galloprovincialis]|uniref:Uncharacterized protein n=1 Tax=Mytilus galloprovincialis TaxID=29158 RepID=A0A8B6C7K9_MYTGA|nr:Hypothetical predicted protein [Mytilus galloprovincialis]